MTTETTPRHFDFAESRVASRASQCTFQPKGKWSAIGCLETATVYIPAVPGLSWSREERRCPKHFKIDLNTAIKRGYGVDHMAKYVAFDGLAAKAEAVRAYRAEKAESVERFWAEMAKAVESRDIATIRRLVNK